MDIDERFIEQAKEIIGKWGYEEEYWWRPVAMALSEMHKAGIEEGKKPHKHQWKKCEQNICTSDFHTDHCETCGVHGLHTFNSIKDNPTADNEEEV